MNELVKNKAMLLELMHYLPFLDFIDMVSQSDVSRKIIHAVKTSIQMESNNFRLPHSESVKLEESGFIILNFIQEEEETKEAQKPLDNFERIDNLLTSLSRMNKDWELTVDIKGFEFKGIPYTEDHVKRLFNVSKNHIFSFLKNCLGK